MSRARTGSRLVVPDADQSAVQAWHALVDALRLLPSVPADDVPSSEAEQRTLAEALDRLAALLALRRSASPAPPAPAAAAARASPAPLPPHDAGTPTSGTGKRKRRPSASPAPAPASAAASASAAPHTGGSESALSSVPSPLPRVGTPGRDGRKRDARDARDARDVFASPAAAAGGSAREQQQQQQHPLLPRRKVVVRPPRQKAGKKDDDEGDRWILAAIKGGSGDKGKYEVVDEDDGTTWHTSLAHIIALPDPSAPASSPAHPANHELFPRQSRVLALYPDTTEFYSATVVAPPAQALPPRAAGKADPRRRRAEEYALEFEDDGETVQAVSREMVVAYPG